MHRMIPLITQFIKLRRLTLAAIAILLFFSSPSFAQERQNKIEAALLYSLFNYITWPEYSTPADLQSPLICVYGDDEIMPYLEYVRNKMSAERNLQIKIVADTDKVTECHILFMRHLIPYRLINDLPATVITVIAPGDPLDREGLIELSEEDDRIAIKINQTQLEQSGFKISSRLLNLAKSIR